MPADRVLGVAGRMQGLDGDGAEGEGLAVGNGLGDCLGVFACDYGELLAVGGFELGQEGRVAAGVVAVVVRVHDCRELGDAVFQYWR